MIILLGPDGTGKTVLARKLQAKGLVYYHFVKETQYPEYIKHLCALDFTNAVLDRHMICEYPYVTVMRREFKYTVKQWHNVLMLTFMQNPLVILCTHKPARDKYSDTQYLPYDRWDMCMQLYLDFLNTHHVPYISHDYAVGDEDKFVDECISMSTQMKKQLEWWYPMWTAGYGCTGSCTPQFLLVAERIGPNNMNNIPFETGPTGHMLSDMLVNTAMPLHALAITNMVKSFRRDTRKVNARDLELLDVELTHLRPKKVVFMGSIAKQGVPIARSHGCEVDTIVHLGSLNHRGVTDMRPYWNEWRKIVGMVPSVKLQ